MSSKNFSLFNKKFQFLSWTVLIQWVLAIFFVTAYIASVLVVNKINNHSAFQGKISSPISIFQLIYDSGKVSWLNKFLLQIHSSTYHSAGINALRQFFNTSTIDLTTVANSSETFTVDAVTRAFSLFHGLNIAIQLSTFIGTLFVLCALLNVLVVANIVFYCLLENSHYQFNKLLNVVWFNRLGHQHNLERESKLLEDGQYKRFIEPLLQKAIKHKAIFDFFQTRKKAFIKVPNTPVLTVEHLSFSYETKHNVVKHWVDHYKKYRDHHVHDIDEDDHLFTFKCLFTQNKIVKLAIQDISFAIEEGSFNVIIGPNGCGKSTLIKSIVNLQENYTGKVKWYKESLKSLKTKEIARNITYVPQAMNIAEGVNIFDFLAYSRFPLLGPSGKIEDDDKIAILKAIRDSGCLEFSSDKISDLSGGQTQKVMLASMLVKDTDIIVLDEPTTFFDLKNQVGFLNFLKNLQQQGKTIILILHDLQQAINYATNLIVLKKGELYAQGAPAEIVKPQLFKDVFNIDCDVIQTGSHLEIKDIKPLCC